MKDAHVFRMLCTNQWSVDPKLELKLTSPVLKEVFSGRLVLYLILPAAHGASKQDKQYTKMLLWYCL